MRSYVASLIVMSLAILFAFGFMAMGNHDHGRVECIAGASQQGVLCPDSANPIAYAIYHWNAFQGLSTAVLSSILSLALFAAAALWASSNKLQGVFSMQSAFISHRTRSASNDLEFKHRFDSWLARVLERRDA